MIRTWKAAVTLLSRFEATVTSSYFHHWLTLAPACLNILSFPEYHGDMWESLRKYLSRADAASHFCLSKSSEGKKMRRSIETFWRKLSGSLGRDEAPDKPGEFCPDLRTKAEIVKVESAVSLFALHASQTASILRHCLKRNKAPHFFKAAYF